MQLKFIYNKYYVKNILIDNKCIVISATEIKQTVIYAFSRSDKLPWSMVHLNVWLNLILFIFIPKCYN